VADQPEISIIVPCFNEAENVEALATKIFDAAAREGVEVQVVFVDDGSSDGTWERLQELQREYGAPISAVRHSQNLGIAAAWRSGLQEATGRYSCFIDADLQHDPHDVFALHQKVRETGVDVAQGIRSMLDRPRDLRWLLSRGLNSLLNAVFGHSATDSKSGFVLAPSEVLQDIVTHRRGYHFFQSFVTVAAKAKGYSVIEVETAFKERKAGRSFMAGRLMSTSFRALSDFAPAVTEFRGTPHPMGYSIAPATVPVKVGAHPYRGRRRLLFEAYFATMPLHKWMIGRTARRLYLELKVTERFTEQELRELQLTKLRRLILHAYNHVPFYRRRMDDVGAHPLDIRTFDDLPSLPLLSKDNVREHLLFDLFADNHREADLLKVTTSGSTGEPFTTYADRYQLEARFATTLRALEWTGWRFGDRQARLWHQTLGMSWSQIIRERIDAWFMRRLFIPAFEISPTNIEEFISAIRGHRPILVDGYAESLNFLAMYVSEGRSPGFSPRAIMSSAQALPRATRRAIEDGFATRVFDKYGSREFSGIAYQCGESEDHHVMDESYVVEVLVDGRPALPGEIGEVVITDLNNFSVPLIRYRIGDLAVEVDNSVPCPCGRAMRRIGEIQGRTQAIVHCANGTWLPGTFFAHFFKDHQALIRAFQIHQERKGEFTLKVVKNEDFAELTFADLLKSLRQFTGPGTRIDVEFLEAIPLLRTGKRSPVVSTVREDFQELTGNRH